MFLAGLTGRAMRFKSYCREHEVEILETYPAAQANLLNIRNYKKRDKGWVRLCQSFCAGDPAAELGAGGLGGLGLAEASPTMLLVTIAIAFFIGCMFVDPIVVILVFTPIFKPFVDAAGIDPVLVGVIVTLQAAIGSATPPFGCDIFTAIAVFRRPYLEVIKGTPPFIVMLIGMSALLILVPEIALYLRDLAFGY